MENIFSLNLFSELIKKLEQETISSSEHDYLKKIITSSILIQKYNKARHEKIEPFIVSYYNWLTKKDNFKNASPKIKTEYFLLKIEIESYFHFFRISFYNLKSKEYSNFEQLQIIAGIWGYSLNRTKNQVLNLFAFLCEKIYEIPTHFIQEIFNLLNLPWRSILSPIAAMTNKKFSLQEIEEYFFGGVNKQAFEPHILPNADRLFSITSPEFKNLVFLPKNDDFDLFEAALVVHEFQHIQDSRQAHEESLFILEKNALQAEKIFLNILGTGKRGRFCWLESNLFYPILLLKWELDIILYDAYDINNFYTICHSHSMEPISLSPLFNWRSPFNMSVYCAASMDLEQNWKNYMRQTDSVLQL